MIDEKQRSELIREIRNVVSKKIKDEVIYRETVASSLYFTLLAWVALERDDEDRKQVVRDIQAALPIDVEACNALLPAAEEDNIGDTRGTA